MDPAFERSLLPFQICQDWRLRVGYERSFKMRPGQILANRYLLGITTDQLNIDRARELSNTLAMPADVPDGFWDLYSKANLILIGFEDSQPGCIYKLYLEFDEQPIRMPRANEADARLLHRGLKWNPDQPSCLRQTDYVWRPEMVAEKILSSVHPILNGHSGASAIGSILSHAFERIDARAFRYLDIEETGKNQDRHSFDLNLYPAELEVGAIWADVQELARVFQIDSAQLERLRSSVSDRPLGHLAAGIESANAEGDGTEFCTVYFEAKTG